MTTQAGDLAAIVGRKLSVVATIDHPYTSPPVHLFAGHQAILAEFGPEAVLMNWDVSHPVERTFRYDLLTDTGLVAKDSRLYHYVPDTPYNTQSFNPAPWRLLPRCFEIAAGTLQQRWRISDSAVAGILQRARAVLSLAQDTYRPDQTPATYTHELLASFYGFLGHAELGSYIRTNWMQYSTSPFLVSWIPWCVRYVRGPLAITNLLASGIFSRTPFRARTPGSTATLASGGLDVLAADVELGRLVPSLDVFLWSLAVAGIRHYGHDFGFFSRLAELAGDPTIARLQATTEGTDCPRFLQLQEDFSVLMDIRETGIVRADRAHCPAKPTRINSLGASYVVAGERLQSILQDFARGQISHACVSLTELG